jgi:hypothetical protein
MAPRTVGRTLTMKKLSGLILLFALLVTILSISQASAENGWRYWKKGEVTREAWTEGQFSKIEVDNISYTFMPAAKFFRVVQQRHGGFSEEPIHMQNVYQYQKVNMLVQGFRIYQLNVTQ